MLKFLISFVTPMISTPRAISQGLYFVKAATQPPASNNNNKPIIVTTIAVVFAIFKPPFIYITIKDFKYFMNPQQNLQHL